MGSKSIFGILTLNDIPQSSVDGTRIHRVEVHFDDDPNASGGWISAFKVIGVEEIIYNVPYLCELTPMTQEILDRSFPCAATIKRGNHKVGKFQAMYVGDRVFTL